jgi:hypothetical protein
MGMHHMRSSRYRVISVPRSTLCCANMRGCGLGFHLLLQVRVYNVALGMDAVETLYAQGRRSEIVRPLMLATV